MGVALSQMLCPLASALNRIRARKRTPDRGLVTAPFPMLLVAIPRLMTRNTAVEFLVSVPCFVVFASVCIVGLVLATDA